MGQVFWSLNMFGTFQQNTEMRLRERLLHRKQEPNDEAENILIWYMSDIRSYFINDRKTMKSHLPPFDHHFRFSISLFLHLPSFFTVLLLGLLKSRFNFRSGVGSGKSSVEDVKHLGRTHVDVDSVGTVGTGAHSEPKDEPIKMMFSLSESFWSQ